MKLELNQNLSLLVKEIVFKNYTMKSLHVFKFQWFYGIIILMTKENEG